jgi:predicted HNH restriction endonuclease
VATQATLDRQQRKWLRRFGAEVARRCKDRNELSDIIINTPSSLKVEETDTGGWYVEIGRVRPDRGSGLQLWLDMWPSPTGRKLYMCYQGSTPKQMEKVVRAGSKVFGTAISFDDNAWEYDPTRTYHRLKRQLPDHTYGKPIAELYKSRSSWSFYGVYVRQAGKFSSDPPKALIKRAAEFLEQVARAVLAQIETDVEIDQEFSAVENRKKVVRHYMRDRSPTLARMAKLRDGFTCQVCDFSFEELYGKLGRGFAEAHHRVSLSNIKTSSRTKVQDLVTVCANCHRMLHQMNGKSSDVASLRKIVSSHR